MDAFLADAEDVIDDWESAGDAASWSADGSHEYESDGNYYLSRQRAWAAGDPASDLVSYAISRALELDDEARDARRPSPIILDEAQLFIAPVDAPLPTAGEAEAWSRIWAVPNMSAQMSYYAIGRAVELRVTDADGSTDDARRPASRRRGVDAQQSPFGPRRRSH